LRLGEEREDVRQRAGDDLLALEPVDGHSDSSSRGSTGDP
jgi:hypothetical protein